MNRACRSAAACRTPVPTTTVKAKIGSGGKDHSGVPGIEGIGRIPRLTRLLALAHRINAMIGSGRLRDGADAARVIGVTRARMTQIGNLLQLAPSIQEAVLDLSPVLGGRDPIGERDVRPMAAEFDWGRQEWAWLVLEDRRSPSESPIPKRIHPWRPRFRNHPRRAVEQTILRTLPPVPGGNDGHA